MNLLDTTKNCSCQFWAKRVAYSALGFCFVPLKNTDTWIYESLSKFQLFLKKVFITVTLIIVVTERKDIFCINLLWLDLTFPDRFSNSWLHNVCFTLNVFLLCQKLPEIVKCRKYGLLLWRRFPGQNLRKGIAEIF